MIENAFGMEVLFDMVDRELLKDYDSEDYIDIDEILDKIEEQLEDNEESFYNYYANLGIYKFEGEDDEDLKERIIEYEKLEKMKKAYAMEKHGITDKDVDKEIEKYREDVCVIPLAFSTQADADEFYNKIKDLNADDLKREFAAEYEKQLAENEDEEATEDSEEEESDFECEFVRYSYDDFKSSEAKYRDLIFDEEKIKVGSYNKEALSYDGKYHIVYKVSKDNVLEDETKLEELRKQIKEELIEKKVNQTFIDDQIAKLREEKGLVIYDHTLASIYSNYFAYDSKYKVYKKPKRNSKIVAKVDNVTITADELYEHMIERGGLIRVLDYINYEALSSISGIKFTKKELKEIENEINKDKTTFRGIAPHVDSWKEYVYNRGGRNVKDLRNLRALNDLVTRYITGYESFAGAHPVTRKDVLEAYKNFIESGYEEVKTSHILFKFDLDGDGEITDEERERAEKLANQLYYGVNDENRIDEKDEKGWSNILFEYVKKEDTDDEYESKFENEFIGLINTDGKLVEKVFAELAKKYSEDGSAEDGGLLDDPVKPDRYIKYESEFEKTAIETGENLVSKPFTTKYGYHIIYVHEKKEAAERPSDYFELTDDELEEKIESDSTYKTYDNYIKSLKNIIEQERLSNRNFYLAKLRDEKNVKFKDEFFEKHYRALQTVFLTDFDKADEE